MLFLHAQQTIDSQLSGAVFHNEAIGIGDEDEHCNLNDLDTKLQGHPSCCTAIRGLHIGAMSQWDKTIQNRCCQYRRQSKWIIQTAIFDQIW